MMSWKRRSSFKTLVKRSPEVRKYMKAKEIDMYFDFSYYTRHADEVIKRATVL
jgi:adenylosuccinate lyase